MTEQRVLVTGACGEIGQALVQALAARGYRITTADLAPLPESIRALSAEHARGDLIYKIKTFYDHDFDAIFHLAASLSSKAEVASEEAHRINVEGTMQLLMLAAYRSEKYGKPVKFIFPSSIAAYGMENLDVKKSAGRVKEDEYNDPHTMYGCNKLYCEKLGTYYGKFFGQKHLDENPPHFLDFRAIRFPGLISAFTLPSSGTSDYGPEMLHAAAQGKPYACFVGPDARIPFMAMPDAVRALVGLLDAPSEKLSIPSYNVGAFSLSAGDIAERVKQHFPRAEISFAPDPARARIVDSWPEDVEDARAREDWGWRPAWDVDRAFDEYLIPSIRARYKR